MGDERDRSDAHGGAATVLVVDDRPRTRLALCTGLTGDGYRVCGARNGAEALDVLLHEAIDVLVVDERLLDPAGELLHCVRRYDGGLPIILQSGAAGAHERRCVMRELHLHGIHQRDGDASQLLELVQSALCARRGVARARVARELQGSIVSRLCQDLLTALHVIRGYTQVLRSEPAPPSTEAVLMHLERAGDDALALVQDCLDLGRPDLPDSRSRQERVDLDALLDDLCVFARRRIADRPLRFVIHGPRPGASVCTDGQGIRAILSQLIASAVKCSHDGDLQLTVREQPQSTCFVLVDSGFLFEDELLAQVRSIDESGDAAFAGIPERGVGLAIAWRLSALIGASLTVEPARPRGTIFTLSVPARTAVAAPWAPTLH